MSTQNVKTYKIGNNTVHIHGQTQKTERLENALKVFMSEVFKQGREQGNEKAADI